MDVVRDKFRAEGLVNLPDDLKRRITLMIADTGIKERYSDEIQHLQIADMAIVEAYHLLSKLGITNVPYFCTVDGSGHVVRADSVFSMTTMVEYAKTDFSLAMYGTEVPARKDLMAV